MPEPVMVSVAAALAGKAAGSLYEFVRTRIKGRDRAEEALSAVDGATPESTEVAALANGRVDPVEGYGHGSLLRRVAKAGR